MGGGQSSEPRTVTVQTAEGEAEITVTQDFLDYISGNEGSNQTSQAPDETTPTSTKHSEYSQQPPSAEELLLGGNYNDSNNQWKILYEEEKMKNSEYKNITTEGFENAASEVKKQFIELKLGNLVPVCEETRERVQKCYHDNTDKILNCSAIVHEYTQCVKNARKALLIQTSNNEN